MKEHHPEFYHLQPPVSVHELRSEDCVRDEGGRFASGNSCSSGGYRGRHTAPQADRGAPLHDLSAMYPDDVYSPDAGRLYGHNLPVDAESARVIRMARDKPELPVKIYRAVPKDKNAVEINHGDWVTINKEYAKMHGESSLMGNYKILSKVVPASHVFTEGNSIHEWGYDPQTNKKPDSRSSDCARTDDGKFASGNTCASGGGEGGDNSKSNSGKLRNSGGQQTRAARKLYQMGTSEKKVGEFVQALGGDPKSSKVKINWPNVNIIVASKSGKSMFHVDFGYYKVRVYSLGIRLPSALVEHIKQAAMAAFPTRNEAKRKDVEFEVHADPNAYKDWVAENAEKQQAMKDKYKYTLYKAPNERRYRDLVEFYESRVGGNCGDGAGGFQSGNSCAGGAKEGGGGTTLFGGTSKGLKKEYADTKTDLKKFETVGKILGKKLKISPRDPDRGGGIVASTGEMYMGVFNWGKGLVMEFPDGIESLIGGDIKNSTHLAQVAEKAARSIGAKSVSVSLTAAGRSRVQAFVQQGYKVTESEGWGDKNYRNYWVAKDLDEKNDKRSDGNCGTGAGGFQAGNTCASGKAADAAKGAAVGAIHGTLAAVGGLAPYPPYMIKGAAVGATIGAVKGLYDNAQQPTRVMAKISELGSSEKQVSSLVKDLGGHPRSVAQIKRGRLQLTVRNAAGKKIFHVEMDRKNVTVYPRRATGELTDKQIAMVKRAAKDAMPKSVRIAVKSSSRAYIVKLVKNGFRVTSDAIGSLMAAYVGLPLADLAEDAVRWRIRKGRWSFN